MENAQPRYRECAGAARQAKARASARTKRFCPKRRASKNYYKEKESSARSAFFERFRELESVWERELEPVVFGAVPSVAEVEALFREALEASG